MVLCLTLEAKGPRVVGAWKISQGVLRLCFSGLACLELNLGLCATPPPLRRPLGCLASVYLSLSVRPWCYGRLQLGFQLT